MVRDASPRAAQPMALVHSRRIPAPSRAALIPRITYLAALLAFVLLLTMPMDALAAPRDPVLAAISKAKAAKQVTPAESTDLAKTWLASGRAVANSRAGSRRSNIIAVRGWATMLARQGSLTADRLDPVMSSVNATMVVMLTSPKFPSHEQELRIPGEVAVFTYYSGRGVQLQPFETFKEGMRQLNQLKPQVEEAQAIADRMLGLGVQRGSALVWEYHFPFNGPSRPWTSAISQALATEFYYRVAAVLPAEERAPYLDAAAGTTRSFLRSTGAGGVASPQETGSFYAMYSFAPGQRILNGHLQSLLNVNRYAKASGSVEAKLVVERGIAGVMPLLAKFDTGAWSNYQPGQEAELGYHEFQTSQLVKLGDELPEPTFVEYGARFEQYLVTPATLTFGSTAWLPIIPARDGFRDTITIPYTVDKRARATLVIESEAGVEVRRFSNTTGRGAGRLVWDGRTASGAIVPDGAYVARITTTDIAGNRGYEDVPVPLQVARDVLGPTLSMYTVREAGMKATLVTVRASDVGSAWVDASIRVGSRTVASRRGGRFGLITLRVPLPMAQVKSGVLALRDSSGNQTLQPLTPAAE
ncbi:MAG: D-glucuronyl C5-epimerase domain protein [Thermoleophilia bacterium]|nr:D-glucuronyl C5-epimerase domain protein [Thermoleophilia bacterium]